MIPPVIGDTGSFSHHIEKLFAGVPGNRAGRRRKSKPVNAEVIGDVLDPEKVEPVAYEERAMKAALIHDLRDSIHTLLGAVPLVFKEDGVLWDTVINEVIPA